MSLRDIVQSNQSAAALVAVLVIAASALYLTRGRTKPAVRPDLIYFYDLGAADLFPGDRTARPPIDAPSGAGRGVRAHVFACGECSPHNRQVAYLMTYTDKALAAIAQLNRADPGQGVDPSLSRVVDEGTLVAVPVTAGEPRWVIAESPEGIDAVRRAATLCGGSEPTPCYPD